MSFNPVVFRNANSTDVQTSSSSLKETTTRQKISGIGTTTNQALVTEYNISPCKPLFLKLDYRTRAELSTIDNVQSIGLSQLLITGLPNDNVIKVLALKFTDISMSLQVQCSHNLTNIPKDCIFITTDGTTTSAAASFGGEPIILYQKRRANDLRFAEIELYDIATGNPVQYTNIFLWMFIRPINWQ